MNSVAARVAAVGAMSPTTLKLAWTKQFGSEPPDWPPSLMARAITYAMQAKSPGGLSKRVTKYLDRVADALEARAASDSVAAITTVIAGKVRNVSVNGPQWDYEPNSALLALYQP